MHINLPQELSDTINKSIDSLPKQGDDILELHGEGFCIALVLSQVGDTGCSVVDGALVSFDGFPYYNHLTLSGLYDEPGTRSPRGG